ncbi:MAG: hypothetical protein R2883_01950 [Caldisericia bacterium]
MELKRISFYALAALVLLFGSLGFISGRQRTSSGNIISDISVLKLGYPGVRISQNPTDHEMLDVRVEIGDEAQETEYFLTAFEITNRIVEKLEEITLGFESIRLEICSGNWKTTYIVDVSKSRELKNGDLSVRSFWVDVVLRNTPKLEMINTAAKPSIFLDLVDIIYRTSHIGIDTKTSFQFEGSNNLSVGIELENFDSWQDELSDLLICIQIVADETDVYIDKVNVLMKNLSTEDEILVKLITNI